MSLPRLLTFMMVINGNAWRRLPQNHIIEDTSYNIFSAFFLHRKQLKLKINRLRAQSLQILSSMLNTPCKTGENKTAVLFGRVLATERCLSLNTHTCVAALMVQS